MSSCNVTVRARRERAPTMAALPCQQSPSISTSAPNRVVESLERVKSCDFPTSTTRRRTTARSKIQSPPIHTEQGVGHMVAQSGLDPPRLNSAEPVTGVSTPRLRIENKRRRRQQQLEQAEQQWWTRYNGAFTLPPPKPPISKHRNKMCPRGLALHHPAAGTLTKYALGGCPTMTGAPWTIQQMQAAIKRGPHVSALLPAAMAQLDEEIKEKVSSRQA